MKLSARDDALCRNRSVPWQYRLALYVVLCKEHVEAHNRGSFMAKLSSMEPDYVEKVRFLRKNYIFV